MWRVKAMTVTRLSKYTQHYKQNWKGWRRWWLTMRMLVRMSRFIIRAPELLITMRVISDTTMAGFPPELDNFNIVAFPRGILWQPQPSDGWPVKGIIADSVQPLEIRPVTVWAVSGSITVYCPRELCKLPCASCQLGRDEVWVHTVSILHGSVYLLHV